MHEKHAGAKTKLTHKGNDLLSFLRRTCADDRTNNYFKLGMFPQTSQALLQVVENLLGRFVRLNPVDGQLHPLQARLVELLNQLRLQKEAVCDHARAVEAKLAAGPDEAGKLRMHR